MLVANPGRAPSLDASTGRIGFKGKGASKTLYGLDLAIPTSVGSSPKWAKGLGLDVPDGVVAGIQLPLCVMVG